MTHSTTLLLLTPRLHANHLNMKPVLQNLSTEQSRASRLLKLNVSWRGAVCFRMLLGVFSEKY